MEYQLKVYVGAPNFCAQDVFVLLLNRSLNEIFISNNKSDCYLLIYTLYENTARSVWIAFCNRGLCLWYGVRCI